MGHNPSRSSVSNASQLNPLSPVSATPPPASPTPPPAGTAAPAPKGNRTLMIVLIVLGVLFLLIGGCAVGCVFLVKKGAEKAQQYSEQAEKNPAYATVSMLAALHPGVEVTAKDPVTGKITIRNKKTNEVVTLDTTQYDADRITQVLEKFAAGAKIDVEKMAAQAQKMAEDAQKTADAANSDGDAKAAVAKLPDFVSAYPGAETMSANVESAMGMQVATYTARSKDKPKAILDYYEGKLTKAGFMISGKSASAETGSLAAMTQNPIRVVSIDASVDGDVSEFTVSFQQATK